MILVLGYFKQAVLLSVDYECYERRTSLLSSEHLGKHAHHRNIKPIVGHERGALTTPSSHGVLVTEMAWQRRVFLCCPGMRSRAPGPRRAMPGYGGLGPPAGGGVVGNMTDDVEFVWESRAYVGNGADLICDGLRMRAVPS